MATPNIIDQLGISWTLHVDTVATLYYDHPVFGYLEYSGVEATPWLCDNTNTLYLTSQGTGEAALPDGVLPKSVCIRPKYSGECGDYDKNTYNPPGDKCLCKDIECDFDLPLFLTCDGVTQSCIGHFVKGTDATECEASGPTYTAQCPLNGVLMEVRIYCAAGTWRADLRNDGVLCDSCVELTIEACPFRITGSYTAATCANDCVPCIGEDCPDLTITTTCCDPQWPASVDVLLTSSCAAVDGTTVTLGLTAANTYFGQATLGCGDVVKVTLETCLGGNAIFGTVVKIYSAGGVLCLTSGGNTGGMICSPPAIDANSGTFSDNSAASCACACAGGDTVEVDLV